MIKLIFCIPLIVIDLIVFFICLIFCSLMWQDKQLKIYEDSSSIFVLTSDFYKTWS